MRITIDAARECEPERWNSNAGRATGTKEEIRSLNVYLDSMQAKVYEAHRTLLDAHVPVTVENIKNKLRGITERSRIVIEVFQQHNNQVEKLIPISIRL